MKKLPLFLLSTVCFTLPAQAQVLISEVQPNPTGSDDAEWIEIHNAGGGAVDVAGYQIIEFAGASVYAFPPGTMLGADQVVIVAREAVAYTAMATGDAFPVTVPDYELFDSDATPDMVEVDPGTNAFGLANGGGGVILRDATGTATVSTVEWGGGRAEVPGSPVSPGPGSGETVSRVNVTGSSDVDFVVLATPTPGTGFGGVVQIPPAITNPTRADANLVFDGFFSVTATVVDGDGIDTVRLHIGVATASVGDAIQAYMQRTMNGIGGSAYGYSANLDEIDKAPLFPEPVTFHDWYVRYFIEGTDLNEASATAPLDANGTAPNANYYWENVLPPTAVATIAEVREQDVAEIPIWDGHSVRIEGVALTTHTAFSNTQTNFFISSETSVDAIRVFDDEVITTPINPGDVVRVVGKVGVFRGVRQVGRDERAGQPDVDGPEITVTVIGTSTAPERLIDIATLLANGEQNESQLIRIDGVTLVDNPNNGNPPPATWPGNDNVYVSDGTGTLTLRIDGDIDLVGLGTPQGMFDIRGILQQFAPNGTGGYQLQPRGQMDVIGGVVPPMDAGVEDQGAMDNGGPPVDTGTPDTGVTPDTGNNPVDTGTGGPTDVGFFDGPDDRDSGCSCEASHGKGAALASLLSFLAIGLMLGLRRKRK